MPKRLVFLSLTAILLLSCAFTNAEGQTKPVNFSYMLGDDMRWAAATLDDSSWTLGSIPGKIAKPAGGNFFWLRMKFQIPKHLVDKPVWLEIGRMNGAADIYANGTYIGSRGRLPPRYDTRTQLSSVTLIPENCIQDGQIQLALRCYFTGKQVAVTNIKLVDTDRADTIYHYINFIVFRLNIILSALCFFMGFYFFVGFLSRRDDTAALLYTLSSLFISIYFADLGFEKHVLPEIMQSAFAKECLTLSVLLNFLFFMKYFKMKHYKAASIYSAVIIILFGIVYAVFSANDTAITFIFNINLLPIFATIIMVFVILIQALRQKQNGALPILIGLSIGFGFALHDIVYTVLGISPIAWLQGLTFFTLNFSIFIVVSRRNSMLYLQLDQSRSILVSQRDKLSSLLLEARSSADAASGVAKMLDDEVIALSGAAERSMESADKISSSSTVQKQTLNTADAAIQSLLLSISTVKNELDNEAENIEKTVANTHRFIEGVSSVGTAIHETSNFAQELGGMTLAGKNAVQVLSVSMERVRAALSEIKSVVEAVNEFSDQTNLLAMNASIEAAHAGEAGRGFAVVAHEIKALAQASSERASKIAEIVTGIEAAVKSGFDSSVAVSTVLSDISNGALKTSSRIHEAAEEADKQKTVGAGMASDSRTMAQSAAIMKSEAAKQSALSEKAAQGMRELQSDQNAVAASALEIVKRNDELLMRVRVLRDLADRMRLSSEALVKAMGDS